MFSTPFFLPLPARAPIPSLPPPTFLPVNAENAGTFCSFELLIFFAPSANIAQDQVQSISFYFQYGWFKLTGKVWRLGYISSEHRCTFLHSGTIEPLCGFQNCRCMRDFTTYVCLGKPREHPLQFLIFSIISAWLLVQWQQNPWPKKFWPSKCNKIFDCSFKFFGVSFFRRSLHSEFNRLNVGAWGGLRWWNFLLASKQ